MTQTNTITIRNTANAQHSTGPKSADGKGRSSQNALTHGATARPKPYHVAQWLSVILNKDPLSMTDLEPSTHLGRCALELAKAEARLAATENSRRDRMMTGRTSAPLTTLIGDLGSSMDIVLSREGEHTDREELDASYTFMATLAALTADQCRLTWRYQREAQSARRRALKAWIAALAEAQTPTHPNEPSADWQIPKQTQRP